MDCNCKTLINLSLHVLDIHEKVLDPNKVRVVQKRRLLKDPELKCVDCSFKTPSCTELLDHVRDVHKREVTWRAEKTSQPTYVTTSNNTNDNCNERSEVSGNRQKRFPCELCGHKFVTNNELNDHFNSVHLGLRPYKCDLCDFKTGQASNLFHHKRKGHTASRNGEKRRTRKRKQEKDSDIKCSTDIPKSDANTKTRRKRGKDAELKCLECSFNIKSTIKL